MIQQRVFNLRGHQSIPKCIHTLVMLKRKVVFLGIHLGSVRTRLSIYHVILHQRHQVHLSPIGLRMVNNQKKNSFIRMFNTPHHIGDSLLFRHVVYTERYQRSLAKITSLPKCTWIIIMGLQILGNMYKIYATIWSQLFKIAMSYARLSLQPLEVQ